MYLFDNSPGSIKAYYETRFQPETAFEDPDSILTFISNNATDALLELTFIVNGTEVKLNESQTKDAVSEALRVQSKLH